VNTMKRRTFLKGTVASGVIVAAAGAGLLRPTEVLASTYPKGAFGVKGTDATMKKLFGTSSHTKSSKIKFINPNSIAILIAKNPGAMGASVDLSGGAKGYFRTKVKMGKTSDVIAVVKSGGKLYSNKIKIKVTVGGCGG